MKLLKQSFLYFKEGNSDKVYEIDLCDVGKEKFVVNFRYGKRGAQLKEGSKTPVPVVLAEAEKIFDAVETEKINKGYTTSETGVSSIPSKKAFTLESTAAINSNWMSFATSRNKAILQRLHHAITGTGGNEKIPWKLSRVIWKAGEYQIAEACPYIIKLFNTGNQLHQYCCTWALARCSMDEPFAIAALRSIYNYHPAASIAKIAGAGLVKNLAGAEKEIQLNQVSNRLPEALKNVLAAENATGFDQQLQEMIAQQQPNYKWLDDVYLLCTEKRWMRPAVKKLLQQIPLRPNYFKQVRSIFKLSELLDDFEITGQLAYRFEQETEMFSHNNSIADDNRKIFIPEMEEWISPQKEFKKTNSRLAYSQKTRWYFHARVLRRLQLTGNNEDIAYVKLATAILTSYQQEQDFKAAYSTHHFVWNRNKYEQVETRFPQNAQAVFLHQLLNGNNPEMVLNANHAWRFVNKNEKTGQSTAQHASNPGAGDVIGSFIKKLTSFFGSKKEEAIPAPVVNNIITAPATNSNVPFLPLWNKAPQAYIQLLMEAALEAIHEFAETNLLAHPDYNTIKGKLDLEAIKKLLGSGFKIPAGFGYRLAVEKYSDSIPPEDLVLAMLNSIDVQAQQTGQRWTEKYQLSFLQQSSFITGLIFANHAAVRTWAWMLLKNHAIPVEIKNAIVGKSVATLLAYSLLNKEDEPVIKDAGSLLFDLFPDELKRINIAVVADLLQHDNALVLLFGLRLLKIQQQQLDLEKLSGSFLFGLLNHSHELVRQQGTGLLNSMSEAMLLQHQDDMIAACVSVHENVRNALPPLISRMAEADKAFGIKAAGKLMPLLLRKEIAEGMHASISELLCSQLSDYLQGVDKTTALNLLYSNYSAAQNVGVMILEKYTEPSQLTLPQVIALSGHENLTVREWSWKFYSNQTARIKYETEAGIKLLESKWQDTRQFAMQYFRQQFTENDWQPEVLITLADSVKPDVEAFGRELITKFFTSENGTQYLLKLSQHPSEKMQLFATNYLERFAADDVAKIESLDFYFRSVLTRVNKSRTAKNRIYDFLLQEGRKSEAAAKAVCMIVSDVSAMAAIGDKAKCIELLMQLKALYAVGTPMIVKEVELR